MSQTYEWYAQLKKPTWAPPSWVFGPVWTLLYAVIAVSYGAVVYQYILGSVSLVVLAAFVLNLVFNFIFTPIQFRLKNNLLASIDILLVLCTLVWALVAIYSSMPWITYVNIPYLLWVLFATTLQLTITYLNP